MKRKTIIALLVVVVVLMWFLLTTDCVINRARSGTPVDWVNIKDCSY